MTSYNNTDLPNPFTPLAFLPPDLAYQLQITRYIVVGSLGALIWDILSNMSSDYKLLFRFKVRLPTIVYFVSRFGALFYVLTSTIIETGQVPHCQALEIVVDVAFVIAIPVTSLLFFLRIRAVFNQNKYVVAFFFFLWLSVLAGCLTIPTAITADHIGTTDYCIDASLKPYAGAANITPLVHDTLVFIAISWRLHMNPHVGHDRSFKQRAKTLFSGEYLPTFTRSFLRDGQLYYLITVGSNLLTVIMVYNTSVPVTYRTMFTVPNIMLMNAMACQVFRRTKFDLIRDPTIMTSRERAAGSIPLAFVRNDWNNTMDTDRDFGEEATKTDGIKTVNIAQNHRDAEGLRHQEEDSVV